jgi:hypothetical protein
LKGLFEWLHNKTGEVLFKDIAIRLTTEKGEQVSLVIAEIFRSVNQKLQTFRQSPKLGIRCLSLDGGGSKALSTVEILELFQSRLPLGVHIVDVFDIICW